MAALFTRMICADCDAVIAPTPKISRLLAGYGVHCPVRIIPTGLDLQRFAVPRDDALRSRLGLPPKEANKTVLLSLGRLAKEKNTVMEKRLPLVSLMMSFRAVGEIVLPQK